MILMTGVCVVLLAIWIMSSAWYSTAELTVDGGNLVYRALGRQKKWPLTAIKRLVRGKILVQMLKAPSYANEQLMFIDSSGRCLLRLGPVWSHTRIAHAIGIPIEATPMELVTAGDAARTYPGSYWWLVAHPLGRYFLGMGLGVVVIGAIVLVISVHG